METGSRYGGQLRIYLKSSNRELTRGGPPAWRLGGGLTTFKLKKQHIAASDLADSCDHANEHSGFIKEGEFLD
jgi:hypothetical protein